MRNNIFFLLRLFVFWMIFFALLRIIFILYNQSELYYQDISDIELLGAFYHALVVDMATASYLLAVSLLIVIAGSLWKSRLFNRAHNIYILLMVIIFGLITAGELGIYPEWKTKLSAKALKYLKRPDEVFFSISGHLFFSLLGTAVIIAFLGKYSYDRLVVRSFEINKSKIQTALISFVVIASLLFVGMRGGFGPIPVSPSAAYFSKKNFLNHTAVNTGFNLAISVIESNKFNYVNPFNYHTLHEARDLTNGLNDYPKDSTVRVLDNSRPNIVVLLMESWSADLIESLGGEPGITPEFNKLEKEGILFTDFYASGGRSQQAIASIIGGFPATPYSTITENPDKYAKLPSLVDALDVEGYHTSFYFGGKLTYGNIRAYLYQNQFDRIIEQSDFDPSLPSGRLGIHDEYLFDRYLDDSRSQREPFFSMLLTLSSHSPYDQPMRNALDWKGAEGDFVNSAYYSDSCLGVFFEEARKTEWYDNTLFIIMADHSHNSYKGHSLESFPYHKVPLLFYGQVLKDPVRGARNPKISQTADVTVTLLNQMAIPSEPFRWGKDLFNPYSPGYAYFELHYAFGWKRPVGEFVYSWDWDYYYQFNIDTAASHLDKGQLVDEGKAYLQLLFQEFIDL